MSEPNNDRDLLATSKKGILISTCTLIAIVRQ